VHLERLKGLQPSVGEKAVAAFQEAKEEGLGLLVTCGLRTFPEQARLYAQGRTRPGRIVTNAKPGQSYHNFGLAFDFVVVKGDRAIWNRTTGTGSGSSRSPRPTRSSGAGTGAASQTTPTSRSRAPRP